MPLPCIVLLQPRMIFADQNYPAGCPPVDLLAMWLLKKVSHKVPVILFEFELEDFVFSDQAESIQITILRFNTNNQM